MRWILAAMLVLLGLLAARANGETPFGIQVIDEQTGRGVPLVELKSVSGVHFFTDSAGYAAIDDPVFSDRKAFFNISSLGYEITPDGFGSRGRSLLIKAGEIETLKLKRLNIAERLYRVTGEGIYRDTVMLGKRPPIANPLLNAQVAGQDSVQAVTYRDKLYFFFGDTSRPSYPLGLYRTAGATAERKTDPSVGIDLKYFTNADGFARAMLPGDEPGAVWTDGAFTLKDDAGRERLLAHAERVQGLTKRYERSLLVFDDESQTFKKLKDVPLDAPLAPTGQAFRVERNGTAYIYFPAPLPCIRVRATWNDVTDLSAYEALTSTNPPMWKRGVKPAKSPELKDGNSNAAVKLHGASVNWNAYRKKWVMIADQAGGASLLGEVWYAEANAPEGPWGRAVKIATHHRDAGKEGPTANFDFYNPVHHPFFDQENGRVIYFEGTYTNSFSGDPRPTPRYEYNQLMYRLDLSDPRLKPAHEVN